MSKLTERIRRDGREPAPTVLWRRLAWPAAIGAAWAGRYATEAWRHRRDRRRGYELADAPSPGDPLFRSAAESLTGYAATTANRAELLINGDRIFPAILAAVRGAKRTLCVETYVYWQGEIAREFAVAICERAAAGVECRVLLDALGSARMDSALVDEMRHSGARVIRFRPPTPARLGRAAKRSHRRIIVVDGDVGFTGGVGIAREWTGDAEDADHWRDSHVRIEGPAVDDLHGAFAEHWVEATGEVLTVGRPRPATDLAGDGSPMQVVRSGSRTGDTNIEILYFLAIAAAKRSIDLTAAYFAPRQPFIQALCDAAKRGVAVRILVPGAHADKQLVRIAGRHAYEQLLDGGVEVHEYGPTMLHAKTMVVDGTWASIGTVNFDNRSFQLNDELTLSVFGGNLPVELAEVFERDLLRSERIDARRWARRGPLQRAAGKLTVPLRREL